VNLDVQVVLGVLRIEPTDRQIPQVLPLVFDRAASRMHLMMSE
jgi:hypothetical protein